MSFNHQQKMQSKQQQRQRIAKQLRNKQGMAKSEYSQFGSRNHSSAKKLKSNGDGDASSIYISRMIEKA